MAYRYTRRRVLTGLSFAGVAPLVAVPRAARKGEIHPTRVREETLESRGMPCLFLNTQRGFGGKPPKKSGFRRHLAGSKMPKEKLRARRRWLARAGTSPRPCRA